MKKRGLLFLLLSLAVCRIAVAGDYRFIKADDFRSWLQEGKKVAIIDIQPAIDFEKQHFRGSIETNAYPVKSDESRQLLGRPLPQLAASSDPIVIVCPRGGGGAKAAYDYLKSMGIDEQRLLILEGGMQGWPHKNLVEAGM
jgi:rhodanese-related sulfurtransferase